MESVDQQFRQLKEKYEHMSEGELCALAEDAFDLTQTAREALQAVLSERGIAVRLKLELPAPLRAEPPDDEGLINLGIDGWPANAENARLTMGALSAAGIPSFLGPDNVMHLEEFRGKFDGSVSLKIRDVDRKRALAVLKGPRVALWTDKKDPDEEKDYAILCPKCRSAKVVLKGRDTDLAYPPPTAPFHWHCDACAHHWSDEGIEQEVLPGQEEEGSGEEHS